ncbi:MAG: DeoR/GlpR family DNA-binding transcription regulator [Clostridia bacterium]|nr:DeoR/GlpR family DNA-binding transcription regulator [Clostridia bacterium]
MKIGDRTKDIMNLLKDNKAASVEELAKILYVSPATIRRDLTEMEKAGIVKRTHGGVIYVEKADEVSIYLRQAKNPEEKSMVAYIATHNMPDFSTVFIDNSSTCLALVERLNLRNKTVFTNGLQIALAASQQDNVSIVLPGGEVKYNTTAVHGSLTARMLGEFNYDIAVTSCAGADARGSYESSLEAMEIKKIAMERAKKRILIFDRTKIGQTAPYCTAPLQYYDLVITNASNKEAEPLKKLDKNLVITNF